VSFPRFRHRPPPEDGFTLTELLVALLIITVLTAIALPTFVGTQNRTHDRRAQSNLRNALMTERQYHVEHGRYTESAAELEMWEPVVDWTHADATRDGVLPEVPALVVDSGIDVDGDGNHNCSVNTSGGVTTVSGDCSLDEGMVCLVSVSASGRKYLLVNVATGPEAGTYYNEGVDCPAEPSALAGWSGDGW
jgi:prepilin-type N-terminal cleavage/methylation domain-containing protein